MPRLTHFGDLRSLLHEPASTHNWARLCAWIQTHEVSVCEHDYIANALRSWPSHIERNAPTQWIEKTLAGEEEPLLAWSNTFSLTRYQLSYDEFHALLHAPHSPRLHALRLPRNELDDMHIAMLCDAPSARHLHTLDLEYNDQITVVGIDALIGTSGIPTLRELGLCGLELGKELEELHAFHHALSLRKLDIDGNSLHHRTVEAISYWHILSELEFLKLHSGGGSKTCEHLARSPFITQLRTLKCVYLEMGVQGARALAQSPNFRHLIHLEAFDCEIETEGCQALLESPYMSNLEHLDIRDNHLGPEALRSISNLTRLHTLKISDEMGDEGLTHIARGGLSQLKQLSYYSDLTRRGVSALRDVDFKLEMLDLSWCKLDLDCLDALLESSCLDTLCTLDLSTNPIGDDGLAALSRSHKLRGLRHLELDHCEVSARGLKALATSHYITQLESLGLKGQHTYGSIDHDVWQEELEALASANFSRLHRLDISDNTLGTSGMKALVSGALHDLKHLDLRGTSLEVEAILLLTRPHSLHALETLSIGSPEVGQCVEQLVSSTSLSTLKSLDLSSSRLDDDHMATLCEHFALPRLHTLRLRKNSITDASAHTIAGAHRLSRIELIDLDYTYVYDEERVIENSPVLHPLVTRKRAHVRLWCERYRVRQGR